MTQEEIAQHINNACTALANAVKASGQQSIATVLYCAGEVCIITATIAPANRPGSQLVIPTPQKN